MGVMKDQYYKKKKHVSRFVINVDMTYRYLE
jgi:hypothetical protein